MFNPTTPRHQGKRGGMARSRPRRYHAESVGLCHTTKDTITNSWSVSLSIAVCTVTKPPSLPMHGSLLRGLLEQALVCSRCFGSTSLQTAVVKPKPSSQRCASTYYRSKWHLACPRGPRAPSGSQSACSPWRYGGLPIMGVSAWIQLGFKMLLLYTPL